MILSLAKRPRLTHFFKMILCLNHARLSTFQVQEMRAGNYPHHINVPDTWQQQASQKWRVSDA